jgi:DNA-binding XRE family transcriptional regulator
MEIIRKVEGDGDSSVEFYTVALTGQSGMSQSGLAIFAGVSRTTIQNLEKALATSAPSKVLEPFVGQSLTLATPDPTIEGKPVGNLKIYRSSFCAAVLKHYANPDQENPTAVYSLLRFAERGIDDFIQEVTGWKEYCDSRPLHTGVYIKRIEHMRDHKVDDNLWMVFREAAELLLLIEKDWRVPINDYDILDGSIGRRWSDYRKNQQWVGSVGSYIHQYRDQRGSIACNAFEMVELPYFRRWLREEYIPTHLPQYLTDKYGKSAARLIYTENGLLTDKILSVTEVKRKSPVDEAKFQDFLASRQRLLGGA